MAGRITIVKMQILPKLIHLLVVLPSPNQQLLNEINNVLLQFIWNNKRPKIQLNTVPHSDTCGAATHSLNIGAGSR